jgi:hypothetical protein
MSQRQADTPASSGPRKVAPLIDVAGWGLALVAATGLAITVALLVQAPSAGLDPTDEGLYVLSADNHQPLAGHNGWFGRYTGLLFGAVGYDIGRFRVAGVLVLVASGLVLGLAIVRLLSAAGGPRQPLGQRMAIVLGTGAASLINYSLFIRTPGYNWLTFVGAAVAVAGILMTLTLRVPFSRAAIVAGLLLAGGGVLALWGKASAGAGLAVIALAVPLLPGLGGVRARWSAIAVAAAGAVILLLAHFGFIADPAATVRLFLRSAEMVAVMDPRHSPGGAVAEMAGDIAALPADVLRATSGLVLVALAPLGLLAVPRARRSPLAVAAAVGVPVAIVSIGLLLTGEWRGGSSHYGAVGVADVAVLATAAVASALVSLAQPGSEPTREGGEHRRRLVYGSLALLGAAGVYAFGSANGFIAQTNGVAALVLAAAVAVVAIPLPPRIGGGTFAVAASGMAVVATVILATGRAEPYRMAPLEVATETVAFGPHGRPLVVDPAAAAYWRQLVDDAGSACWVAGMRLLDLTWNPADAYALDATVPEVLIPLAGHFVTGTASAQEALRVSDAPAWHDAWLLTSPDLPQIDAGAVVALAMRSFPADYRLVTTLKSPGLGFTQELWRPADASC